MLKPIIYPYKMGSKSATTLATTINTKKVYPNRNYHYKDNHIIINWGNSNIPNWETETTRYFNAPWAVNEAKSKHLSFRAFSFCNVSCPDFTESKEEAQEWIEGGYDVFARTVLTGHSGKGIVICNSNTPLVDAPLYTKKVKCREEYRVHVFCGEIIDVVQKKLRNGNSPNPVRNHSNGYVFAREGVIAPICVLEESIKALRALGLDFGAVDVGYNSYYDRAYIFEVNTAPGLEGTTIERYNDAILRWTNT